jgi:hypothetical protein
VTTASAKPPRRSRIPRPFGSADAAGSGPVHGPVADEESTTVVSTDVISRLARTAIRNTAGTAR